MGKLNYKNNFMYFAMFSEGWKLLYEALYILWINNDGHIRLKKYPVTNYHQDSHLETKKLQMEIKSH